MNLKTITCLLILTLLSGCTSYVQTQPYRPAPIGRIQHADAAIIISAQPVTLQRRNNNIAPGSGAIIGSNIGSMFGAIMTNDYHDSFFGIIGGAIVGAIIGAAIETSASQQQGMQYVMQTNDGQTHSLIQARQPLFYVGDRVLILHSTPTRIVLDTNIATQEQYQY